MWRHLKRLPLLRNPAVRRHLKQLPGIRHIKRAWVKTRRSYYRRLGAYWLAKKVARIPRKRIVLGAWSRFDPGWIPTQREFLNLTEPRDFERCFEPNSVEAMLAEHVWEHLTPAEGLAGARTCFKYLKHGGYLRVAVPDGLHPDPTYLDLVKPGPGPQWPGRDGNSANHKALYAYDTLSQLFEIAGFEVHLYEYFDETGQFHSEEWDRAGGTIWRSKRFDPRNKTGERPAYTRAPWTTISATHPSFSTR